MTIKELINRLNQFDENTPVAISKDAEGNNYSKLAGIETGCFSDRRAWDLDYLIGDGKLYVVLYPV